MPLYLSQHRIPYTTLSPSPKQWPARQLFNFQARIQSNLTRHEMHAVQIGPTWVRRCLPVLALDSERLIVGAGGDIVVHPLVTPLPSSPSSSAFPPLPSQHRPQNGYRNGCPQNGYRDRDRRPNGVREVYGPKAVGPATTYHLSNRSDSDIVGLHSLPSGELIVAQFDGMLQRLSLSSGLQSTAHYAHPREHIYALSGHEDRFLALSSSGRVYSSRSPWIPPVEFELGERPWSGLLTSSNVYVGVRGEVSIYHLRPEGIIPVQSLRADPSASSSDDGMAIIDSLDALDSVLGQTARRSTPYSIVVGQDPNLVLSAWHDGIARLHDTRTGACELEFADPWQDAPLYCAAFLGENHVAAGGSQHGILSIFDMRNSKGYSVFTPEGKGSPVYGIKAEGGRVWGVSERRAFVCAWDGSGDVAGGLRVEADVYANAFGGHGVGVEGYGLGGGYGGGYGAAGGAAGGHWRGGRGRGRGRGNQGKDIPTGYRRRGGKWAWTVGYGEHEKESCMGYRHEDNGTTLFETRVPV